MHVNYFIIILNELKMNRVVKKPLKLIKKIIFKINL